MPKLILKFETAVIKEIPISSSVVTVGRKSDNDVVIDHPAVSGHHCKVMLQGDTYFVEDLNSTNGTLMNGKKIIKAGLHNQDTIAIAKHSLVFVDDRTVSAHEIAQAFEQADAPPAQTPQTSPVESPAPPEQQSPEHVPYTPASDFGKTAGLRITDGIVDQVEYTLTETSTYIGKSDRVAIKIKGFTAPEVAAMVAKKTNGYFLVAIKDGYPKVNGLSVQGERLLREGDMIEVGGTKMQFFLKSST